MKGRLLFALAFISSALLAQNHDIYRCEHDGVIEFSDQPCDADTEPYRSEAAISVIDPSDDLDQIQQANRAWLADYRALESERQEQRRQERLAIAYRQTDNQRAGQADIGPRFAPAPWAWPYGPLPTGRPPYFRPGEAVAPRPQPYSALSGPFPGTRRQPRDDDSNNDRR